MNLGARIDQMHTIAAGVTVGTAPMIWSNVVPLGPLDLRAAHLAGAITLLLVLLPRSSAVVRSSTVIGLGSIGLLTVLGATFNAFAFQDAFWPTSELLRLIANLLIALAVVSSLTSLDSLGARRMGWATGAALSCSLGVWLRALELSDPGIVGAIRATLSGRTRHLLYDVHLPALQRLYGDGIELGVRHSIIFGFLIAVAVLTILSNQCPQDRWLRVASRVFAVTVMGTTVLSSSRSGLAALILAGLAFAVSRRHVFASQARAYAMTAMAIGIGATTVFDGLQARFTDDTESFKNRQLNASVLLDGEWSLAGLPALPATLESPHNSFIEMAAGGGLLALVASGLVALIALAGLAPRRSASLPVLLLSSAVILRMATAARGSLDTSAMIALAVVIVSLSAQSATARTSWRSSAKASSTRTTRPISPMPSRAWKRYP